MLIPLTPCKTPPNPRHIGGQLTPADLEPLSWEDWVSCDKLTLSDSGDEGGDREGEVEDSDDEVQHISAPTSTVPRSSCKVEGVFSGDPFLAAHERNLHGAPVPTIAHHQHQKAYVVFRGRKPGVYQSWPAANDQVLGHPGASFKSYSSVEDARRAYSHALSSGTVGQGGKSRSTPGRHCPVSPVADPAMAPASTKPVPSTSPLNDNLAGSSMCASAPPLVSKAKPVPVGGTSRNAKAAPPRRSPFVSPGPLKHASGHASTQRSQVKFEPAAATTSTKPAFMQSRHKAPPRSDVALHCSHNPEDEIFVVIRGRHPGIYYGRPAANAALGNTTHPNAHVEIAGDKLQAYELLTEAVMDKTLAYL